MHCWEKHNLNLPSLINKNISNDFLIFKFCFTNSDSFIRVQVRGCGYPVLHFHFAYNSCVEFRTRALCKRSGWRDVMRAARLACHGTCGDYELISVSFIVERLVQSLIYNSICNLKTLFSVNRTQLTFSLVVIMS